MIFAYRKQTPDLWFNHNYGGRTQFAPTEQRWFVYL